MPHCGASFDHIIMGIFCPFAFALGIKDMRLALKYSST